MRVDEVRDLDVLHADEGTDVRTASTIEPGHADPHGVVGPEHFARRLGAGDGDGRGGGEGRFQEPAASETHGRLPRQRGRKGGR